MYDTLYVAAQAGSLQTTTVKSLYEAGILTAEQRVTLLDTNREARKRLSSTIRAEEKSAAFRDLRGIISRAGLPSDLATLDHEGQVTISHGGHRVTFPSTQTKRLAPMVRAFLSAISDVEEQDEDQDDEAPPLSLVGNG